MKNNPTKLTKWMMLVLGMMLAAVLIAGCTAPEANTPENSNLLANEQPPPNSIPKSVNSVDDEAPTFLAEDTAQDNTVETPLPAEAERLIELAKRDLAERLSIDLEEIQVTASLQKEWPDASLGCPQTDIVYAQVVTKGYLIILQAEGKPYEYHTDLDQQAILCVSGNLPMIPVTPGEIDDGQPWVPVD